MIGTPSPSSATLGAPLGAAPANPTTDPGRAIDLDAFRAQPVDHNPFAHVIIPGFVRAEVREAIHRDFPEIEQPGSFPARELSFGPAFAALLEEIQGPAMKAAFEEKFGIDLTGHPTMVTVRGRAKAQDGQIHVDSKSKIITVLIYMNPAWETADGRLRLLRGPESLDNAVAEIPPAEGTLLAFVNGPTAWHGHTSFVGPRRVIQLNWVQDDGVVKREQFRHALSAKMKRLNPFR
ncbi:2OG-Fe(II) oxygenase [Nitrospirillum sp. BR 11828]|uniref:2OG-Fe(II) oxygenase n=1 Tax=Nitrospirillum sp. BR 11828 TaxID=3104325 RepID=UPI002ACA7B45|nr:2OG-Fe(II) oxygenase [Nitrospirillum sp. BR 11828]MDZ5647354.1 2OG-Fe(II) oxygenase [Nitrospirillum sp. BR 11828]